MRNLTPTQYTALASHAARLDNIHLHSRHRLDLHDIAFLATRAIEQPNSKRGQAHADRLTAELTRRMCTQPHA